MVVLGVNNESQNDGLIVIDRWNIAEQFNFGLGLRPRER